MTTTTTATATTTTRLSYALALLAKFDAIFRRCQFHQHFTLNFFVQKCFAQDFFHFLFGFVIFWHKNISTKAARKMLMKLTAGMDKNASIVQNGSSINVRT